MSAVKRKYFKMSKLRLGSEYIPLVDNEVPRLRIVLPFSKVAWGTVSLTFFAFAFCILYSIIYNFEKATATHCKVYNVLPSVSAAIGHYRPQKTIWTVAISFQAIIKFIVLSMYYKYYKETAYHWANGICNVALFTYFVENISLVTLSFWSSNESYVFHKLSFITFLLTSFIHMVVSYNILNSCRKASVDHLDNISLNWKYKAIIASISSISIACYCFYRHNKFCEPYVYSIFAFSEYVVVVANMLFHVTAAFDFASRKLLISTKGVRII